MDENQFETFESYLNRLRCQDYDVVIVSIGITLAVDFSGYLDHIYMRVVDRTTHSVESYEHLHASSESMRHYNEATQPTYGALEESVYSFTFILFIYQLGEYKLRVFLSGIKMPIGCSNGKLSLI